MSAFTTVAHDIVAGAKAFKAGVLKVVGEAPVIINTITSNAPEVEALTSLVFPGAVAIEKAGLDVLTQVANAVSAAGDAATSNGLSVSFDQALINDVKALIPVFESFLKGKTA